MNLSLKRTNYTDEGIFGILYDENDKQIAVTLEHAFDTGAGDYEPKIAAGTYTCVRYDSPDHGYVVFVLEDVPDFMGRKVTYCEIHIGNYNADSDGCIVLGSERNGNMIMDSKVTFKAFMLLLKDVDSFTLTIT